MYHETVTTIPPIRIKTIAMITCVVRSREPKNHPLKITIAIFWDANANGATIFTAPLLRASNRRGNAIPIMIPEGINSGRALRVCVFQIGPNFIETKIHNVIDAAISTTVPDHHDETSVPTLK